MLEEWVEVGRVGRPHGVGGQVRVFPHHRASPLWRVPNLQLRLVLDGRTLDTTLRALQDQPRHVVLRLDGVSDREAAERWTHAQVCVPRALFESWREEGAYFAFELEGLEARHRRDGSVVGTVAALGDHGGGAFLVLALNTDAGTVRECLVPFAEPYVGAVHLEAGWVEVDPDEWLS